MSTVSKEYADAWHRWHSERIAELTAPHGWIAMVSQDWLTPGTPTRIENIPGSWAVQGDEVVYYPASDSEDTIEFEGKPVLEPTPIPTGYKYSLTPALYRGKRIETIRRTAEHDGSTIFGVRVRDPREAQRRHFDELPTFELDEAWVIPAQFTRTKPKSEEVPTIENGVLEERSVIGNVTFTLAGQEYTLEVSGRPHDVTREIEGSIHFADLTSGKETYGNGRLVPIPDIDNDGPTVVDFNRAHSFPCAFTNFVTCPLVPSNNRLNVAVTAGEKTPPITIDRIQTFLAD